MSEHTREQLAAVLDAVDTAVVVIDHEWCFTYMNSAAGALLRELGRKAEMLLGKPFWLEFPELAGTACETELRRAFTERVPVSFDMHYPPIDRWLRVHATPMAHGLTVSLADVTLRNLAELKQAVEDRTRLLASERAARGEAEAANRSKDQFLAMLSHELRTPLTAVLGWARMLLTRKLDEAATRRALEAIDRNTRTQIQLINDLLDVSRIVTGKLEMQRALVPVAPAIEMALDNVAEAAERKRITIETTLDPHAGMVFGDDMRLAQVVSNLLGNAVKFTPDGGRVHVGLVARGDDIVVTVSDTGAGITAEDLPRIFQRFHQGHTPRRRATGGLGLGLAIVQHLVQLHGGRVTAESDGPGTGARFSVVLPRISGSHSATVRTLEAVMPFDVDLHGVRVLLVEDDADSREIIREMLDTLGANVWPVDSAEAALETLTRDVPSVIVSDIGLAGLDGFSMIRRIRALRSRARDVPAIALTAYARDEDRATALAAGYQMYLTKPVEPAELRAAIARLTQLSRSA